MREKHSSGACLSYIIGSYDLPVPTALVQKTALPVCVPRYDWKYTVLHFSPPLQVN